MLRNLQPTSIETSPGCLTRMLRLWQTCNSRPLQTCSAKSSVRCSDPQCVSQQQPAAKQALDEPSKTRGLPQRLISKPQRQSTVHKRTHLAQHFDLHQLPKPALNKVKADDREQPGPKEINHWLVDASSPEQILTIYAQHQERFNMINISTALHRLAKVYLQACPSWLLLLHMVLHKHLACLECISITTGLSADSVEVEEGKCMMSSAVV